MFAEPARTPYDLNFRLFGFPVRIHPLFWLGAALLGASTLDAGLHFLLIWIARGLVSILVHELGHAVAFRGSVRDSHIVLWMFGGLAVPYSGVTGRWRRICRFAGRADRGVHSVRLVYGSHKLTDWGCPRTDCRSVFLYAI